MLIQTPRGPLRLIDTHPMPAAMSAGDLFPLSFDPTIRNRQIDVIRGHVEASLAAGETLLMVGDFNTSPTEGEYRVLTKGLRDTQVEIGEGPGWTWRPNRLEFTGVAFLRLDLQLTAGSIRPSSISVDCSHPGDHCQVVGGYEMD